jgi:DNA-binding winged helix-turn-helix (wHTH) protein
MSAEPMPAVVRFGDFELDLRSRELRRGRLRLNLETKPFQILELLVENSDRLVTRKELREKLWPDSVVEFDRGIYTAMNRLRKALGDTRENPRYIQTRSGLGYRFVAPLTPALVRARLLPYHRRRSAISGSRSAGQFWRRWARPAVSTAAGQLGPGGALPETHEDRGRRREPGDRIQQRAAEFCATSIKPALTESRNIQSGGTSD